MPKLISKALKLISNGQNKVSKTRELTAKIRTKVSMGGNEISKTWNGYYKH